MIIAVNTRLLIQGKLEGIGWFTRETFVRRITRDHPEHQFLFIFDRPFADEFIFSGNVTPIVLSPPTRHPFLWYIWFELQIPRILKKYKADLFFFARRLPVAQHANQPIGGHSRHQLCPPSQRSTLAESQILQSFFPPVCPKGQAYCDRFVFLEGRH